MTARSLNEKSLSTLPALRFEISEAAHILRMSRVQLYIRIQEGSICPQKDGARTYITCAELERYVQSCGCVTVSAERSNGKSISRRANDPLC